MQVIFLKNFKKITMLIILIFIILFLTGCSDNNNEDLKTKVISEMDYMNTKIINILNKLNNISFESYSILSEQVELSSEEEKSKTGEQSSQSSSSSGGQSSGGSGENQSSGGESRNTINSTTMVADTDLNKNRDDIDWNEIRKEIEELEESWAIIVLDLYSLNVKNDTILTCSDNINTVMVAIKSENKQESLASLAELYSSIPQFLQEIEADKNMQKIRQTQSYVINAYVLANDMNNSEINTNITQGLTTYSEVMSDIDYTKDKTEKTNKVYVLLNELANSLTEKDSDVFYIKYKNFMKEIESI